MTVGLQTNLTLLACFDDRQSFGSLVASYEACKSELYLSNAMKCNSLLRFLENDTHWYTIQEINTYCYIHHIVLLSIPKKMARNIPQHPSIFS
jgi:hypothetical protein